MSKKSPEKGSKIMKPKNGELSGQIPAITLHSSIKKRATMNELIFDVHDVESQLQLGNTHVARGNILSERYTCIDSSKRKSHWQINVAESGSGNPGVITVSLNLFESPAGGTVECAYQLSIETGHQGTVGYFVEGPRQSIKEEQYGSAVIKVPVKEFMDRKSTIYPSNVLRIVAKILLYDKMVTSVPEQISTPAIEGSQGPVPTASVMLTKLWNSKVASDVKIVCGKQVIQAHKAILAAGSTILDNLTESISQIDINDVSFDALEANLEFLYTGGIKDLEQLNSEVIVDILKCAKTYNILELDKVIVARMLKCLNDESVGDFLIAAVQADADQAAVQHMRDYCKRRFPALIERENFRKVMSANVDCFVQFQPQNRKNEITKAEITQEIVGESN